MGCANSKDNNLKDNAQSPPAAGVHENKAIEEHEQPIVATSSPTAVVDNNAGENAEPKGEKFDEWRAVHSAIRWKKPIEEIESLIVSKEAANCYDDTNGNRPIHIAAQNGHLDQLMLLIRKGADVNAQNMKGNTAFHMALSYDYYDCVQALQNAGADLDIKNSAGHSARKGLDGDKSIAILSLLAAKSQEEAATALQAIEKAPPEEVERATVAAAGLKTRKSLGTAWTTELQEKLKSILSNLA